MQLEKKTKSLQDIEVKMQGLDVNSMRYQVLKSARDFKTSWISLGRVLYGVWKDKLYKDWGYNTFESYTAREIGIRKQTAMKLLRSYYFLEQEEPNYLQQDYMESCDAALVPTYESIDVLRMAKNRKTIDEGDYVNLKREIFEKGKDAREIKKELTALIRQRSDLGPEQERQKSRMATVKRFLSTLKSLKNEIETLKFLPSPIVKEAAALIRKLEAEIS